MVRKGQNSLPSLIFRRIEKKQSSVIILVIALSIANLSFAQTSTKGLEESFQKAVKSKDYKAALTSSLALGEGFMSSKQFEKAIDWFDEAARYATQLKNLPAQFKANYYAGEAYYKLRNFKEATEAFGESLAAAQAEGNKARQLWANLGIAKAEEAGGRYKRAIDPLERAMAIAASLKDENTQLECCLKLATNHVKLGERERAEFYQNLYQQTISNRQKLITSKATLGQLQKEINRVELDKQKTEAALKEEELRFQQAEDSLKQAEAINREHQLQINLLNKDKELAEAKIREQNAALENERLWRYSIIAGSSLVGILAIVILINHRARGKANKRIHQQAENIKSSIRYAGRIQSAMLPNEQSMAEKLHDHFVLFKPRDTVSGDFYWFSEIKNGGASSDLAFGAVDCTGHGVPGAFMSMIGMNSLNNIVNRGITQPGEVLKELHSQIKTALKQEETGNNDGMDVALCIYHREKRTITFSGAKNPVVYVQNNMLHQIKGDVHPIGGSKSKPTLDFKNHEILIDQPTMIYLFSDGYRDQFGGEKNTKFMSKKFNQLLFEIHHLPLKEQQAILDKTLNEWKGAGQQTDDILVMGVRIELN